MNSLSIIKAEDVILDLSVPTKASLIRTLSTHAAARTGIDEAIIQAALFAREDLGSTGIGSGVAIPHATIEELAAPFAALFVLKKAVKFDSVDEMPVDIVFLLLSPPGKSGEYLRILAAVTRKTRVAHVLKMLRQAESPAAGRAALVEDIP